MGKSRPGSAVEIQKREVAMYKLTPRRLEAAKSILDSAVSMLIRSRGNDITAHFEADFRRIWRVGYQELKDIIIDMSSRNDQYKYVAVRYMETSGIAGVVSEFKATLASLYGIRIFDNTSMNEDRKAFWNGFVEKYCEN